jgi:hypothetical protein
LPAQICDVSHIATVARHVSIEAAIVFRPQLPQNLTTRRLRFRVFECSTRALLQIVLQERFGQRHLL